MLLGCAAIAALAYRHFHRSTPPPVVIKTVTVTIPEGYSRAQAAQLAKEDGLRGSYEGASVRSRYLNPTKYGGAGAKDLEGFLFPDTFELDSAMPRRATWSSCSSKTSSAGSRASTWPTPAPRT